MTNPQWIWKHQISDHQELADHSLIMFDTFATESRDPSRPNVSKWVHPDHMRINDDWQDRVKQSLRPITERIEQQLGFVPGGRVSWSDMWMYQYTDGGSYNWHSHNHNFVFTYYVRLDDPSHTTRLFDPWSQKTFNVEAEEGDVVIFPAFIVHQAPSIASEKVIIAGNFTLCGKINVDLLDNR